MITGVSIRPATEHDALLLAKVHLDTVVTAYADMFPARAPTPTLEMLVNEWRTAFDDPTHQAFLATEAGSAIGTVAIRSDPDNVGSGELRRLHVVPTHWARGIGSALYSTALQALRNAGYSEAGLWVLAANSRARSFYERRGWTLVPDKILEWPGLETIEVRYERWVQADQAGGP